MRMYAKRHKDNERAKIRDQKKIDEMKSQRKTWTSQALYERGAVLVGTRCRLLLWVVVVALIQINLRRNALTATTRCFLRKAVRRAARWQKMLSFVVVSRLENKLPTNTFNFFLYSTVLFVSHTHCHQRQARTQFTHLIIIKNRTRTHTIRVLRWATSCLYEMRIWMRIVTFAVYIRFVLSFYSRQSFSAFFGLSLFVFCRKIHTDDAAVDVSEFRDLFPFRYIVRKLARQIQRHSHQSHSVYRNDFPPTGRAWLHSMALLLDSRVHAAIRMYTAHNCAGCWVRG